MLNELVVLSRSIADLLEHEELSPTPALTSSARQQEAGLKTQEIERIVRRVEAHFVDKVQALEATNATLRVEVRQLRQSRSLGTLSVRFCTEFAFIGKDQKELEEVVGTFPSLKHYVYEDLIGDDALRKKKTM